VTTPVSNADRWVVEMHRPAKTFGGWSYLVLFLSATLHSAPFVLVVSEQALWCRRIRKELSS
jgi:hypothetical protein